MRQRTHASSAQTQTHRTDVCRMVVPVQRAIMCLLLLLLLSPRRTETDTEWTVSNRSSRTCLWTRFLRSMFAHTVYRTVGSTIYNKRLSISRLANYKRRPTKSRIFMFNTIICLFSHCTVHISICPFSPQFRIFFFIILFFCFVVCIYHLSN